MSLHFTVIPQKVRVAAPDEMLFTTVVSRSFFPSGTHFEVDADMHFTRVVSSSTLGRHLRLVTGDYVDLAQTRLVNVSLFGEPEMQEAPPDENLRFSLLANVSLFGEPEMQEAPPDGNLRFTNIPSTSVVRDAVLNPREDVPGDAADDYVEGIAVGPLGGMI